jgi:hypothetical protein
MCLSEMYSRVRVGKHLSDTFPIKYVTDWQVAYYDIVVQCLIFDRMFLSNMRILYSSVVYFSELISAETAIIRRIFSI